MQPASYSVTDRIPSNKPATQNSGNHNNSQNYMCIYTCTYTLQAPTGHYTLQQITATPILLTFDGKLITATMNPMDSQQQSTATKNF